MSDRHQNAKRRRRSPPPLGIGSLSISVGPKPTAFQKAAKRNGIGKKLIIDPDLTPDAGMKVRLGEVNRTMTPISFGYSNHNIITSVERGTTNSNTTDNTLKVPAILPSLRTPHMVPRKQSPKYDFDDSNSIITTRYIVAEEIDGNNTVRSDSHSGREIQYRPVSKLPFQDDLQLWASSISRASSEIKLFSGGGTGNDDDGENFDLNENSRWSVVGAAHNTTSDSDFRTRTRSPTHETFSSPMSIGKIIDHDEMQTASPPVAPLQAMQRRSATWTGTLEDLRPRPTEALPQRGGSVGWRRAT